MNARGFMSYITLRFAIYIYIYIYRVQSVSKGQTYRRLPCLMLTNNGLLQMFPEIHLHPLGAKATYSGIVVPAVVIPGPHSCNSPA